MRSKQLSLNKVFDPSTLSMRKGRHGEKKWKKMGGKVEKNDVYSGTNVVASRPTGTQPARANSSLIDGINS